MDGYKFWWNNTNFKLQSNIRDNLHSTEIRENTQLAWREYRDQHDKVNRLAKSNKNKYYTSRLNINNNDSDDTDFNEYENDYTYSVANCYNTNKHTKANTTQAYNL